MRKFHLAASIIFFLAHFNANAAVIKGVVTDSINNPMPFATVWIEELNRTTMTGLNGSYTLRDVPLGNHTVFATYIGHKKESALVNVTDATASCDFVLDETTMVLPELFVTPNGEPIEQFIMRMVAEHKRDLKDVIKSYDCKGSLYWETDNDSTINNLPNDLYKTVKFFLSLFRLGKLFEIHHDYPGLKLVIDRKLTFDGKIKGDKQVLVEMTPTLKDDEVKYLQNHSWDLDFNLYDKTYEAFNAKKLKKERNKMLKAEAKAQAKGEVLEEDTTAVRYVGRYEEDGRDIYILKHGKTETHIVDQVWQVKRKVMKDKEEERIIEYREQIPGIFLPVSYYHKVLFDLDRNESWKKQLSELKNTDRSKMSNKEQKKLDEEIAKLERIVNHHYWDMQRCYSWDYSNVVPQSPKH